jgi:NTE family protein
MGAIHIMLRSLSNSLCQLVCGCSLAGVFVASTYPALAQTPQPPRPTPALPQPQQPPAPGFGKIGLVLEGGGALGLAHIGVITWLEEHRIPVSYVAGTSMGGLVGGVYATGRSPAEVRELVSNIPWNTVLRGEVPFKNLTYRRKEDDYFYPGSIEFGLKKGLQFPSGFNSGQEVQFILDRVALPYSTMQSFNDMPIPFGCVATDLITAKPYVFRSGSLSIALRSTMSLPGIFSPVKADGQVFADGGLLDNLPVDVAKQMGAELILAIHLETQPMSPDENLSSFGVLGKSISVMIAANEMRSMEQADLLVSVPLDKYSALDYGSADAIIKAGYDAAQAKANVLTKLSVDEATWQRYLAERDARRRHAPAPQFIEVTGVDARSAKAIAKDFASDVNKPVDSKTIQTQINDIQGDGLYSSLNYSMTEKNDTPGLLITANEKTYAPPIVRPQITLDGSQYNNVLFSIGGRITFMNVKGYGNELRNDVIVGSQYGIRTEYYRPFAVGSSWFVAPRGLVSSNEFNAYTNNGSLASIYRVREAGGGGDIGYILGRSSEIRVGYETEYVNYSLQVGEKTEPTVSGREGFSEFRYQLLHTDDPVIPTTGQIAEFRTQWFDSYPSPSSLLKIPGFPLTEGKYTQFVPLTDRTTLTLAGGGGTVYGTNIVSIGLPVFALGGPTSFAAYGTQEILTNNYFIGQVGVLRELKELPPFLGNKLYVQGRFDIGRFQQVGTDLGAPLQYRVPGDVALGLLVNTIFGPVVVGGAVGDAGHQRFFFQLGRVF